MPGAPVGQLLMVSAIDLADSAATAGVSEKLFCEAAETATELLREVWPEIQQVVSRDAAVRLLLDSGHDHAFQYLWAERFAQPEEHLAIFGRSIRGGGLRVVMGPAPDEADPKEVEAKIESFLAEPRQLWVETQMRWPVAISAREMNAPALIREAARFATDEVIQFINASR